MKDKIYTEVSLRGNKNQFTEFNGNLTEKEFELIWDLLDIIWQPSWEFKQIDKKALKQIYNIVSLRNKEIDDNF